MVDYCPKYFTNRAIVLYFIALATVSIFFIDSILPIQFMLFGIVTIMGFFYFFNVFTKKWRRYSEKKIIRKILITAFIIRLIYVLFSYWYYIYETGLPFEHNSVDALMYNKVANDLATSRFTDYENVLRGMAFSDRGYPTYLGVVYMISGKSILIARLIKAVLSTFTCILIYKLAKRNFGDSIGRIAGIISIIMPHFIYYCGLHLKETEMIFMTVTFVERADYLLRNKKYNFFNILIPALLAYCLFFFRTVLGLTALMAFFSAIVFSSEKIMRWGKRILTGIWLIVVIGYLWGGPIALELETVWAERSDNQQRNMDFMARREGGNEYARYANAAVFFPIIFTIPFPTMIKVENQENQQIENGLNFVKNIMAFFTMLGVCLLLYRKKWREHILILSFLAGYLTIIAASGFAHSSRFHVPSVPFALIIAAYGLSQMDIKKKIYYNIYLVIIFIAIIGWSWFKLAGRGFA